MALNLLTALVTSSDRISALTQISPTKISGLVGFAIKRSGKRFSAASISGALSIFSRRASQVSAR